jgi:hypothetical protein
VDARLILAAIAGLALGVGFLYLAPFGPCPKGKGTARISRGRGRRVVHRRPVAAADPGSLADQSAVFTRTPGLHAPRRCPGRSPT